ncbi:unnamed protein product [Urochloa humidicola]
MWRSGEQAQASATTPIASRHISCAPSPPPLLPPPALLALRLPTLFVTSSRCKFRPSLTARLTLGLRPQLSDVIAGD